MAVAGEQNHGVEVAVRQLAGSGDRAAIGGPAFRGGDALVNRLKFVADHQIRDGVWWCLGSQGASPQRTYLQRCVRPSRVPGVLTQILEHVQANC